MVTPYANEVFNERAAASDSDTAIKFCHVPDGRAGRAADVFVNVLQAGLLVTAYNQSQYQALDAATLAAVPILIFPS